MSAGVISVGAYIALRYKAKIYSCMVSVPDTVAASICMYTNISAAAGVMYVLILLILSVLWPISV